MRHLAGISLLMLSGWFFDAGACTTSDYRPLAANATYARSGGDRILAESGMIDGIPYKVDLATSTLQVADFRVQCGADAIEDHRWCYTQTADLLITRTGTSEIEITIGERHRSGTRVQVRIDTRKPIGGPTSGWQGRKAKLLIDRLLTGKTVLTRYYRGSRAEPVDHTGSLEGLGTAMKYMDAWISGNVGCRKP